MDNNATDKESVEIITIFLCFLISLLGGTARELSKVEEDFSWKRFFSNLFISGFCGIIVGLFAPDFEHKNWVMAFAGISGVAGIAFLNFCEQLLKDVVSTIVNNHINKNNKQ